VTTAGRLAPGRLLAVPADDIRCRPRLAQAGRGGRQPGVVEPKLAFDLRVFLSELQFMGQGSTGNYSRVMIFCFLLQVSRANILLVSCNNEG